jgi:hypothetical protein
MSFWAVDSQVQTDKLVKYVMMDEKRVQNKGTSRYKGYIAGDKLQVPGPAG